MKIIVDADACPVTRIAENVAKKYNIPCTLVCDTSHFLESDYSTVFTVSKGADSADYKIVNLIEKGDIVVTQDYGLAAMCMSRAAFAINQNGMLYSDDNIDSLLFMRAASSKARRAGVHLKGPKKRDKSQDVHFETALCRLIESQCIN